MKKNVKTSCVSIHSAPARSPVLENAAVLLPLPPTGEGFFLLLSSQIFCFSGFVFAVVVGGGGGVLCSAGE